MNLFKRNNSAKHSDNNSVLAQTALNAIHDGVLITDRNGLVKFINPAAINMTGCGSSNNAIGLTYDLIIKLESKEGRELSEGENPLIQSMKNGQDLESFQGSLIVGQSDKRIPISISVLSTNNMEQNRIITFRNISKELQEEGEQTEFISTASHEMRTPVASIEGYLSLALNPQTATIDERAKGYLNAAHTASKHLGKLFQDLLDVTKLDDGKIKPHLEPVEMSELIKSIADDHLVRAKEANLNFKFGSDDPVNLGANLQLRQAIYGFVDVNFVREIMNNLIDNAIKYTPAGGSIYVNVRGDGDRALINVTDTGIGISSEDLGHIFQKFYRSDNSDTRTIGGNGLGLYLVKQRAEALGGKVWAESAFGEGSTFYVSLPRISNDEYEKRMIVVNNQRAQEEALRKNQAANIFMGQPQSHLQPTPQVQPFQQPVLPPQPQQQTQLQSQTPAQPQPMLKPQTQPQIQPQAQPVAALQNQTPLSSPPVSGPPLVNNPITPNNLTKPSQIQTNNNLNGEVK